jgi:hypothetical protein
MKKSRSGRRKNRAGQNHPATGLTIGPPPCDNMAMAAGGRNGGRV